MRCWKPDISACSCQLLPLHSPNSSWPLKTDTATKTSRRWLEGRARTATQQCREIQGAADEFPTGTTVQSCCAILFHCAHSVSVRNFGDAGTKAQSTAGAWSHA